MHFVLERKNGFKSIFSSTLLSERNMGIDYIHINKITKIHFNRFVFLFFNCGLPDSRFVSNKNQYIDSANTSFHIILNDFSYLCLEQRKNQIVKTLSFLCNNLSCFDFKHFD